MSFSVSFFAAKFGITRRDLENYLSEALGRGGEQSGGAELISKIW